MDREPLNLPEELWFISANILLKEEDLDRDREPDDERLRDREDDDDDDDEEEEKEEDEDPRDGRSLTGTVRPNLSLVK